MATAQKQAFIVGASRGLGLLLVQGLRQRGWRVTASIRGTPPAELTPDPQIDVVAFDITEPAQIEATSRSLRNRPLDLLYVNAGINIDTTTTIGEVTKEDFVRVMLTNVLGVMRCVEAFAPLVRSSGTIAVMSSVLGSISGNDGEHKGWEVYRASKAALNMLLRSFAGRHADARTILAIAPGWSRTEMGGADAPLEPQESIRCVLETLDKLNGTGTRGFYDYRGQAVGW